MVDYDICPRCHEYVRGLVSPEDWQCPKCGALRSWAVYDRDLLPSKPPRKTNPSKIVPRPQTPPEIIAPAFPPSTACYQNMNKGENLSPWRGVVLLTAVAILGIITWQMLTNPDLAWALSPVDTPVGFLLALGTSGLFAALLLIARLSSLRPCKQAGGEEDIKDARREI